MLRDVSAAVSSTGLPGSEHHSLLCPHTLPPWPLRWTAPQLYIGGHYFINNPILIYSNIILKEIPFSQLIHGDV